MGTAEAEAEGSDSADSSLSTCRAWSGAATNYAVCLYTMSPDEHFIVDRNPTSEPVFFAAGGLSGHGFKFTSVLGEVLADLPSTARPSCPISSCALIR